MKRGPFMQSEMTMEDLQERIESLQGAANHSQPKPEDEAQEEASEALKKK